jgi:hypothetical protein
MLKKLTHYFKEKKVHAGKWTVQENCTVHVSCTVHWTMQLTWTVKKKVRIWCFSFTAFLTQKLNGAQWPVYWFFFP